MKTLYPARDIFFIMIFIVLALAVSTTALRMDLQLTKNIDQLDL